MNYRATDVADKCGFTLVKTLAVFYGQHTSPKQMLNLVFSDSKGIASEQASVLEHQ